MNPQLSPEHAQVLQHAGIDPARLNFGSILQLLKTLLALLENLQNQPAS